MKLNYKTKNNKKALTLIELLIVIAIIGILFIVLVSRVDFATDKSKAAGVQTDFRSFQVAFETVARENAGFNMLGWDTGDANGDHIRNSYDRGDTNKNGKEDAGETFVGRKTYGEDWTTIYTMLNPDTTKPNDTSAFVALEQAINAHLDPKLHITITPNADASGKLTGSAAITMANQARDPWKNEYAGSYITNATVDGLDRGSIVMYSMGANGNLGINYSVANGLVGVEVPGNNINGKDDYVMAVTYSYANGYGEVITGTSGFSNNQNVLTGTPIVDNGVNAGGISVGTGSAPGETETPTLPASEGLTFTSNGDGTCYVSGKGTCEDTDVIIPRVSPDGDRVTSIGEEAFDGCTSLTSVVIPDSVTSIGYGAFWACKNLTSVVIPDSVTSIGGSAFRSCNGLTSVIIGDSVSSIGNNAFGSCSSLTNIDIPDSVKSIGSYAFAYSSLTSITFGNGIEFIDAYAFDDTPWLDTKQQENPLVVANNILVDGTTSSGDIVLPDNITSIAGGAFYRCTGLTSLEIPDSVTSIGQYAFQNCSNLTNITIPDGVVSIGDGAFWGCSKFTSIIIPDNVISIGYYAFYDCSNIIILCEVDSRPSEWDEDWKPFNCPVVWGCAGLSGTTQDGFEWASVKDGITIYKYSGSDVDIVVPAMINGMKVVSIADRTFISNTTITSVEIPDSVTYIGDSVFSSCSNLTSAVIPDSVTHIGNSAFAYCTSLTSIVIPGSVTSIGDYAFQSCSRLTIYCETESKPSGWDSRWNYSNRPVTWGYSSN